MYLPYLFLILQSTLSFDFNCPHPSHRKYRARSVCDGNNDNYYSCLFNKNSGVYVESCYLPPDFVIRGEEYVIVGSRTNRNCSPKRYQPFKFWSNVQSKCIYKKSLCKDIGQDIYYTGNFTDDSGCGCDFTQGYGFVAKHRNPCYCISSEEDCSCYLKACSVNSTLQSDYQCRKNNIKGNINACLQMTQRNKSVTRSENTIDIKDFQALYDVNANLIVITAIVLLMVALSLCFWFGSKIHQCIKRKMDLEKKRYGWIGRIIANWTHIVGNLKPPDSLVIELKLQNTSSKHQNRIIMLDILKSLQKQMTKQQLQDILNKLISIKKFPKKSIIKGRWRKRDYEVCYRNLQSSSKLLQEVATEDLADDFLENCIFDVEDYNNIMKLKSDRDKTNYFITKIQETFSEGSFECLIYYLRKRSMHAILSKLLTDLEKAFLLEFDKLVLPPTKLGIKQTELKSNGKSWKNKRIRFSIRLPESLHIFANQRIHTCSIWFVQILAMYPVPKTLVGSSVILMPLVEDITPILNNSINSRCLNHLIEILCCERHIIQHFYETKEKVHASFQLEECFSETTCTDRDNIEDGTAFSEFDILTVNAVYLQQELSVTAITKTELKELKKHAQKFANFNDDSSLERPERVLNLIRFTENNKLLPHFIKMLESEFQFIASRLESSLKVYATKSDTLRNNIIYNIPEIIKSGVVLNDLKEECLNRGLPAQLFDNFSHEQDQSENMLNVVHVVNIVNAGKNAMCALADFFYIKKKDCIANKLISTIALSKRSIHTVTDQDEYTILKDNRKELILEVDFRIEFEYANH